MKKVLLPILIALAFSCSSEEDGIDPVESIEIVVSGFVKHDGVFLFTDCRVKIQGLNDPAGADTVSRWTNRSSAEARENSIEIEKAPGYRITATKTGFTTWTETVTLSDGDHIRIEFEAPAEPEPEPVIDVYIGGKEGVNAVNVATVWKNEVPFHLSSKRSSVYQLAVIGNDVYATGLEANLEKIFYWKNDEQHILPHEGLGAASGLYVSATDVYVSGYFFERKQTEENFRPVYWKNDEMIELPLLDGWKEGNTTGISGDGQNIYVSGNLIGETQNIPVRWKNGVLEELPVDGAYAHGSASGIEVNNGHTFTRLSGTGLRMGYMKDQQLIDLGVRGGSSFYTSGFDLLTVCNDDVYLLSGVGSRRYWKNNEEINVSPGLISVALYGIAASGNSLYLAGEFTRALPGGSYEHPGAYWVDGQLHELPNKRSTAFAITVVSH